MPQWCAWKTFAALKLIAHREVIPPISTSELDRFDEEEQTLDDKQRVVKFLRFIYAKSNKKLEIYGKEDEMLRVFEKMDTIPLFIRFSEIEGAEMGSFFFQSSTIKFFEKQNSDKEITFTSKYDIAVQVYIQLVNSIHSKVQCIASRAIFLVWMIALTNKHLRNLKGSYDLLDFYSWKPLNMELTEMVKNLPKLQNIKISKTPSLKSVKEFFEAEEMVFFNHFYDAAQDWNVQKCDIVEGIYLIEKSVEIFKRYGELFTPFSQLPKSKLQTPCVRKISGRVYSYYLAKEVENALTTIVDTKINFPKISETEEERKFGIVNAISEKDFISIMNLLGIPIDKLLIFRIPYHDDLESNALPIISSYGSYCVPVWTAFDNIFYYLTVVLRIFQRSNAENLKKVIEWIEELMDSVFQTKPNFYLIEKWKIDEIIDRARKELSQYLTEPEYQIVYQKEYQRNEVFREVNNLIKNLEMENVYIESLEELVDKSEHFQIQEVCRAYFKIVRLYFMTENEKIFQFLRKQSDFKKENIEKIKIENKPMFYGLKKGFLNKEKSQEAEKLNNMESENEELREKLEKVEKKNLKLRKNCDKQKQASSSKIEKEVLKRGEAENQLKTQKSLVKKCEADNQSLREQLELSKKELLKAEKNLKIHLKASSCQIAKFEKELQKSKETETQLTERLEIEVNSVKNDYENVEKEMSEIKSQSEITEKENEQLKKEIEELEEKNVKNSEFQRKIKELQNIFEMKHSNLIDSISSHLRNITVQSVREAKEDIEMLEETIEEYMENVEIEFEKL